MQNFSLTSTNNVGLWFAADAEDSKAVAVSRNCPHIKLDAAPLITCAARQITVQALGILFAGGFLI